MKDFDTMTDDERDEVVAKMEVVGKETALLAARARALLKSAFADDLDALETKLAELTPDSAKGQLSMTTLAEGELYGAMIGHTFAEIQGEPIVPVKAALVGIRAAYTNTAHMPKNERDFANEFLGAVHHATDPIYAVAKGFIGPTLQTVRGDNGKTIPLGREITD